MNPLGGPSGQAATPIERSAMRKLLIDVLTASAGSRQRAEYVVNLLTVHRPDLLASAAILFASDELGALRG